MRSGQTWLVFPKSLESRPAGETNFNQIITHVNVKCLLGDELSTRCFNCSWTREWKLSAGGGGGERTASAEQQHGQGSGRKNGCVRDP